jgi:glycosyltransferase 2 family protein
MVVDSVEAIQRGDLTLHMRVEWLALSAAAVLAAYGVLIWSWLYLLAGLSGQSVPFLTGARIWFVSNLGVWVPGKIWGIVQMSAMSVEQGINPVAASAASIINTAVHIACGMAVGVITATGIAALYLGGAARAWALAGLAMLGILLLPWLIPWAFRFARRRFNASVPDERTPPRLIVVSVIANVAAFILYGAALLCLNKGLVDPDAASLVQHTAAYATSYVIGYMVLFAPGGIGFRERSLQAVLLAGGMATPMQATALSLISRLWLLIIQVLPALIFLAYRRPRVDEKDR